MLHMHICDMCDVNERVFKILNWYDVEKRASSVYNGDEGILLKVKGGAYRVYA